MRKLLDLMGDFEGVDKNWHRQFTGIKRERHGVINAEELRVHSPLIYAKREMGDSRFVCRFSKFGNLRYLRDNKITQKKRKPWLTDEDVFGGYYYPIWEVESYYGIDMVSAYASHVTRKEHLIYSDRNHYTRKFTVNAIELSKYLGLVVAGIELGDYILLDEHTWECIDLVIRNPFYVNYTTYADLFGMTGMRFVRLHGGMSGCAYMGKSETDWTNGKLYITDGNEELINSNSSVLKLRR